MDSGAHQRTVDVPQTTTSTAARQGNNHSDPARENLDARNFLHIASASDAALPQLTGAVLSLLDSSDMASTPVASFPLLSGADSDPSSNPAADMEMTSASVALPGQGQTAGTAASVPEVRGKQALSGNKKSLTRKQRAKEKAKEATSATDQELLKSWPAQSLPETHPKWFSECIELMRRYDLAVKRKATAENEYQQQINNGKLSSILEALDSELVPASASLSSHTTNIKNFWSAKADAAQSEHDRHVAADLASTASERSREAAGDCKRYAARRKELWKIVGRPRKGARKTLRDAATMQLKKEDAGLGASSDVFDFNDLDKALPSIRTTRRLPPTAIETEPGHEMRPPDDLQRTQTQVRLAKERMEDGERDLRMLLSHDGRDEGYDSLGEDAEELTPQQQAIELLRQRLLPALQDYLGGLELAREMLEKQDGFPHSQQAHGGGQQGQYEQLCRDIGEARGKRTELRRLRAGLRALARGADADDADVSASLPRTRQPKGRGKMTKQERRLHKKKVRRRHEEEDSVPQRDEGKGG